LLLGLNCEELAPQRLLVGSEHDELEKRIGSEPLLSGASTSSAHFDQVGVPGESDTSLVDRLAFDKPAKCTAQCAGKAVLVGALVCKVVDRILRRPPVLVRDRGNNGFAQQVFHGPPSLPSGAALLQTSALRPALTAGSWSIAMSWSRNGNLTVASAGPLMFAS
jgi:hypothetical protein